MPSALWELAHAIEASAMRLEGKQYYDIARALRREAVSTGELAFELDRRENNEKTCTNHHAVHLYAMR